jgi:hypothetical protein
VNLAVCNIAPVRQRRRFMQSLGRRPKKRFHQIHQRDYPAVEGIGASLTLNNAK